MLKTTDYPALTAKLNEVFNEAASAGIEEWVGKQHFHNYIYLNHTGY